MLKSMMTAPYTSRPHPAALPRAMSAPARRSSRHLLPIPRIHVDDFDVGIIRHGLFSCGGCDGQAAGVIIREPGAHSHWHPPIPAHAEPSLQGTAAATPTRLVARSSAFTIATKEAIRRRGVSTDQRQAAGAQNAAQQRPPVRVLRTLGVEEHEEGVGPIVRDASARRTSVMNRLPRARGWPSRVRPLVGQPTVVIADDARPRSQSVE
jgi:hypothetical protein